MAERLCFETGVVEHRDKQIAQGCIVVSDITAMWEAASGQEDREIAGVVRVGVAREQPTAGQQQSSREFHVLNAQELMFCGRWLQAITEPETGRLE